MERLNGMNGHGMVKEQTNGSGGVCAGQLVAQQAQLTHIFAAAVAVAATAASGDSSEMNKHKHKHKPMSCVSKLQLYTKRGTEKMMSLTPLEVTMNER